MPRQFTPKVLTANALLEGDVIYLAADDSWVRAHAEARLFQDEGDANAALEDALRDMMLVGPYLADAVATPAGPAPTHFREDFRTRGPSNYAHGKQESDANV